MINIVDDRANISYTVIHPDRNKIQSIRFLTDNTFVMRLDRNFLEFKSGQHISVGLKNSMHRREYSVYSGEKDDYLEILVREVIEGNVSLQLREAKPGDIAVAKGGYGKLTLSETDVNQRKHVFIASGTGIAPFHSYLRTYPGINYQLIHGVSLLNEAYDKEDYDPERYILCTSKEKNGNFHGRVTDYLSKNEIDPTNLFHLCGNSSMIYEAQGILRSKGVTSENIRTEVYF